MWGNDLFGGGLRFPSTFLVVLVAPVTILQFLNIGEKTNNSFLKIFTCTNIVGFFLLCRAS